MAGGGTERVDGSGSGSRSIRDGAAAIAAAASRRCGEGSGGGDGGDGVGGDGGDGGSGLGVFVGGVNAYALWTLRVIKRCGCVWWVGY